MPPSRPQTDEQTQLYLKVRELLLAGDASGRALSSRRLAERFGVSRARIRKVLTQLAHEGVVEKRPQSGTYPRQVDREELRHLYDVRFAIEPRAAWAAAGRVGEAEITELRRLNIEMAACCREIAASDPAALSRDAAAIRRRVEIEMAFHRVILLASGNPLFVKIYEDMHILAQLFQRSADWQPESILSVQSRTLAEHERITDALAAGDAETARQVMAEHLGVGLHRLLENPGDSIP